jgi:hypothetical protein
MSHLGGSFYVGDANAPVQIADESGSLFDVGTQVANASSMVPSTVMAATLASYQSYIVNLGNIIKTTIIIDLTGAKSVATDKDVIGDTGACHVGQITAAVNGTLFKGQMGCIEVPTTGADDIDLYSSTASDGAYNADASGLAGAAAVVTAGGAHAIGTVKPFTTLPAANTYLYLASGEAVAGTYDAGIIYLEMWGYTS